MGRESKGGIAPSGTTSDSARPRDHQTISRRQALLSGAGAFGLIALGGIEGCASTPRSNRQVHQSTGQVSLTAKRQVSLTAKRSPLDLGRRTVETWVYNGQLPGPELRVRQGEVVQVNVTNDLNGQPLTLNWHGVPVLVRELCGETGNGPATTVHWHGVRVASAMDGTYLTQSQILPGQSFLYEFVPPDEGTFMYHAHVGVQFDRGLYGPLIVEPRQETLRYDSEAMVMLDDWIDGITDTPEDRFATLLSGNSVGMGAGPMSGSGLGRHVALDGTSPPDDHLAALANGLETGQFDPGDVAYPLYLLNGRPPEDPVVLGISQGDRLRIRLANIAGDTFFSFFIEDHPLSVVATDGSLVEPVETDALLVGPGERYDVLVEGRHPGVSRMIASPLGKAGRAIGLLRYRQNGGSRAPGAQASYAIPARIASYADFHDLQGSPPLSPDTQLRLDLGQQLGQYAWTMGGQVFPQADVVSLERGATVRISMRNRTATPHPMHLHGLRFRLADVDNSSWKDTVIVPPMQETSIDFVADNPGPWLLHTHDIYRAMAGMIRVIDIPPRCPQPEVCT